MCCFLLGVVGGGGGGEYASSSMTSLYSIGKPDPSLQLTSHDSGKPVRAEHVPDPSYSLF